MRARLGRSICDLLICAAVFAVLEGRGGPADGNWPAAALSALCCWFAAGLFGERDLGAGLWIDQLLCSAGMVMLAEFTAERFLHQPADPPLGVALAIVAANGLLALSRLVWDSRSRGRILFFGFDEQARELARMVEPRLLGVLADDPSTVPPQYMYLGPLSRLAEVARDSGAEQVVVFAPQQDAAPLLRLGYCGLVVVDGVDVYLGQLGRVPWRRIPHGELLLSRAANADPLGMAVQAVYTNVFCLTLLTLVAPLLIVAGFLSLLARGRPVVERSTCLGFQLIPFQLRRFRVRAADGSCDWAGRIIERLGLVNLPNLINVMRGEMSFFGPPPVRDVFAARLMERIPCYSQRFTVKPGIWGWSQANLAGAELPDDAVRLEYDLYYIRHNSFSLDLEILTRTFLPWRRETGNR